MSDATFYGVFQTYPRGVEVTSRRLSRCCPGCFRRTLVGLKLGEEDLVLIHPAFQTYPRGVEVRIQDAKDKGSFEFQTYPRGVEVQTARDAIGTDGGFRRTLVGLK